MSFNRDVLGLSVNWEGQLIYAEFLHEGIRFSMYERKNLPELFGCEPSYPEGINGTFELAIDLPYKKDVDREFQRIVDAGAKPVYPPRDEPWGMRSSAVMDPDGNVIEIGSWDKGIMDSFELQNVTICVSDLKRSKEFYENLLGFKTDIYYEPTKWLSFKFCGKSFLAIMEKPDFERQVTDDAINIFVDDVSSLWERISNAVEVVMPLQRTPWGSYKFTIKDPDGYLLGFVQK